MGGPEGGQGTRHERRHRRGERPTGKPASTTVEVSRLFLDGAVLEVEVTAVVTKG
jgi:enamine deaminase RidA (YjgF/YER057c/UK114 family)